MLPEKYSIAINKLKEIYPGFESHAQIKEDIEDKLLDILESKKLVDNPLFKKIVKEAEDKISGINALLLNDVTLSIEDRKLLHLKKEMWKFNLERFGADLYDQALESIEKIIDLKLVE